VDDPGKLYRKRRRATQAKGLETLDSKAKVEGPSKSPRESPPPSPKEDQPQPPPMGEQPQPEREIELCTSDIVDLPIINLQDAGRPFKIKVSTICMTIAGALERFNEYIRAIFLEWHIGLLKRRMEKMEIKKQAQHLKAAEARSTCKECEEYDHVQYGKVMEVGSSICEVFIMMKMLEMQVGQLAEQPMGDKEEFPRQPQGPKTAKATQTHSREMEDHTKETMKITTEGPVFEMSSHYMKEVVASVKTKGQSQPMKTKNMTKPKNKPVPKMVRKWVCKIATSTKSVDPK
jgi:hypothetical protein